MERKELESFMSSFHKELIQFVRTFPGMEKYDCSLKMDWSARRTMSRGGWYTKGPGVSYAMLKLVHSIKKGHFREYASFEKNKYIGEFYTTDWKTIVKALSCHEQAHAIRAFATKSNEEAHGSLWKRQYGLLREKFVNNDKGKSITSPRSTENSKPVRKVAALSH